MGFATLVRPIAPSAGALVLASLVGAARTTPSPEVAVRPNPNTERAGILHDGVLTLTLEAKPSRWYLDGPAHPAMTIEAFSQPGKAPSMPAPLVRVPAGTELRVTIRNALPRPLTFLVPAAIHGAPFRMIAMDSVVVAPGSVGTLVTRADVPGNYVYSGETARKTGVPDRIAGLLAGALVVDTAGAPTPPRDRVFVLMATKDSAESTCMDTVTGPNAIQNAIKCGGERLHYTINGTSWPGTERLHATVGDTLHWRVINASEGLPHPMHLHGFYYRVDSYAGPAGPNNSSPPVFAGQMVVTQILRPFSAMSISWSPDRPGNWLFHCHTAMHTTPPNALSTTSDDLGMHGMAGLVLGTIVAPKAAIVAAGHPAGTRRLRLVAEQASGAAGHGVWGGAVRDSVPTMHFVLEERGRRIDTRADVSPELDLVRGEPVAITIVNHLDEPTSVHWHGIEVEDSYMDGAAGFSGAGTHLSPAIAPGDSFVARFTPPRSGTFMYHAHVDDVREQLGGLEGALIVRDRGASATDDHAFFLKGLGGSTHPLEINGQANPDTVVLHAGRAARLRFMNLTMNVPTPTFFLTARPDSASEISRDTMLVQWHLMAKDGFDLPAAVQTPRPGQQVIGMGETWDFSFRPERRGELTLEVRETAAPHSLRVRVPIRVE